MDASILQKIQESIKTLILEDGLLIEDAADASVDVSFVAPDSEFVGQLGNKPVVNCYLINMAMNTTMNRGGAPTLAPELQSDNSSAIIKVAPKFVDLDYMITVWSKDEKGSSEIEHLLMGYIISGLGKFEYIPVDILKKHDINVGSAYVEFTLFGNATSREKKFSDNIWQTLGTVQKTSVALTVTAPVSVDNDQKVPVIKEINRILERTNFDGPRDSEGVN